MILWSMVCSPVWATVGPAWRSLGRPALSGLAERHDVDGFRVWFTRTGVDAPPADDADGNGLPDLVDTVADTLVEAERRYAAAGWRALVGDDGDGGSVAIDVYLRDLDIYGYATPTLGEDGTDSCFVEIDRATTVSGQVAASVTFHELHHCVQFRYSTQRAPWLYEAAATYEQYSQVSDPVLELAAGVLYLERLGHPERRLGSGIGRHEYAGFLWMKFWAERGGEDRTRLPALWEALARTDWVAAMESASRIAFQRSLADTYLEHAVWNAFACALDDGRHYRPDPIPCRAAVSVPITAWDGSAVSVLHEDAPYTSATFEMPVDAPRTAAVCHGDADIRAALVAVSREGIAQNVVQGVTGDALEVDTPDGGSVRLVVVGTNGPLDARCERIAPRLGVLGAACTTTGPAGSLGLTLGLLAAFVRRGKRG